MAILPKVPGVSKASVSKEMLVRVALVLSLATTLLLALRETTSRVQRAERPTPAVQNKRPVERFGDEDQAGRRRLEGCALTKVGGSPVEGKPGLYGAWRMCAEHIGPGSIIYSFGIGTDVSFDNALVQRGAEVFGFDPTVTPEHVEALFKENHGHEKMPELFHFTQLGLYDKDTVITFLRHKGMTSMRPTLNSSTGSWKDDGFKAAVLRLSTIMYAKGHTWLDTLKVDIEGAEFDVFLADEVAEWPTIPANQILIEFHARWLGEEGISKRAMVLDVIKSKGFALVYEQANGQEVALVRS